jgi:glycine/D-amino acid oxidase-like deaminating enzyme
MITNIFLELQEKYPDQLSLDSNTPVLRVSKNSAAGPGYLLSTPRGTVKASHVVYCTEAHTAHLLPKLTGIIVPRRGQMTVQSPGKNFERLMGKRSFNFNWDQGHDYLHQNPETGDLVIGGGEHGGVSGSSLTYGQRSDDVEILPDKIHLSGLMRVVFGEEGWGEVPAGHKAIKASWSGILGQSLDHVPLVGLLPQEALHDRCVGDRKRGAEWISVGFGGYGMTNCWMSGVALARQILGQEIPEWFPEQFVVSSSRLAQLQDQVAKIGGTEGHLRALL